MESIPKSFALFASKINVIFNNRRMNDKEVYGLSDYSKCEITLSKTDGVEKLSKDRILDTFYHERTHMILDYMQEYELSKNERFVDIFSKLLRQSDITAKF